MSAEECVGQDRFIGKGRGRARCDRAARFHEIDAIRDPQRLARLLLPSARDSPMTFRCFPGRQHRLARVKVDFKLDFVKDAEHAAFLEKQQNQPPPSARTPPRRPGRNTKFRSEATAPKQSQGIAEIVRAE